MNHKEHNLNHKLDNSKDHIIILPMEQNSGHVSYSFKAKNTHQSWQLKIIVNGECRRTNYSAIGHSILVCLKEFKPISMNRFHRMSAHHIGRE